MYAIIGINTCDGDLSWGVAIYTERDAAEQHRIRANTEHREHCETRQEQFKMKLINSYEEYDETHPAKWDKNPNTYRGSDTYYVMYDVGHLGDFASNHASL